MGRPDETRTVKALDHVIYEMRSLLEYRARLAEILAVREPSPSFDGVARNAFLEAQLLHVRNLIEFLIDPVTLRKGSDISRLHFAGDWSPTPIESVKRLTGPDGKKLINKHLSHLTWERVDEADQEWEYGNIAEDTLRVFLAWAEHLRACNAALADRVQFNHALWKAEGLI